MVGYDRNTKGNEESGGGDSTANHDGNDRRLLSVFLWRGLRIGGLPQDDDCAG